MRRDRRIQEPIPRPTITSVYHVLEVIQLALLFRIFYFEIAHCGLEKRRPVHHVLSSID
jgi:hypothetical protein